MVTARLFFVLVLICTPVEGRLAANRKKQQQQKQKQQSLAEQETETKAVFVTAIAICGAAYGFYSMCKKAYEFANARSQRKEYKKGLLDALNYAKGSDPFDRGLDNMAMVAFANAYENCYTLRKSTEKIWVKLVKKHQENKRTPWRQPGEDELGALILSAANDVGKLFDDVPTDTPGAIVAMSALAVQTFAIAYNTGLESTAKAEARKRKITNTLSNIGTAVGLAGSVIAAVFDPSGLSIISLVGTVGSTAVQKSAIVLERANWRNYYCPALKEAMADAGILSATPNGYYGPITSNADCLELTQAQCSDVVPDFAKTNTDAYQNGGEKLVQKMRAMIEARKLEGHLTGRFEGWSTDEKKAHLASMLRTFKCYWNKKPKDQSFGSDEGCTPCPYMYYSLSSEDQRSRCEGHKSPSGHQCIFMSGFQNECCTRDINRNLIEDMCYG